jgi:uncharacterized membrane protein YgaE (UPF0421/DUF939 family)
MFLFSFLYILYFFGDRAVCYYRKKNEDKLERIQRKKLREQKHKSHKNSKSAEALEEKKETKDKQYISPEQ